MEDEDNSSNNKKICLSPSITQVDASLPSEPHDSAAMPVPSSTHDPQVKTPQSNLDDVPMKIPDPSEDPAMPSQSSLKDPILSPNSHDHPATLPESHDVSTVPFNPTNPDHHNPPATPPVSHDPATRSLHIPDVSVKSQSNPHNVPLPHNISLPHNHDPNSLTIISASPPLLITEEQDQLEFGEPAGNIINTQLNQQINEVQHFLKIDRLKRTKLPDTNDVQ